MPRAQTPPGDVSETERLAERADALLPQTQCTRCGYPSCRDYARALAGGETTVNRCPPGGEATIGALAALLGVVPEPLDPACGEERPWMLARIDESACIGCTLCIHACPVDAIVGAAKRMHTVIASECTGCELCLSPCPMDCIELVPMPGASPAPGAEPGSGEFLARWMRERAPRARSRHERRRERLARSRTAEADSRRRRREARRRADLTAKRAVIDAAVARARARRARVRGDRT